MSTLRARARRPAAAISNSVTCVAGLRRLRTAAARPAQPAPITATLHRGTQRPRQWVRIAIQSLRSGVSEVRWCSTWKPSASISRSSVR